MTDYVKIKQRAKKRITADTNDIQSEMSFTSIINFMGYLEAIQPTARISGVYIDNTTTHICYIPFDLTTYKLDVGKLYAEVEQQANRNFKLKKIMNYGEQDEYLALFLSETGFTDVKATEG
jgi:hypothetical protein